MKKYILSLVLCSGLAAFSYAQVGINTTSPESTLDIRGKNHLGAVTSTDGILVPRVNDLTTNGSVNGQLVYLIADAGSFTKGFYYWNGSAWTGFSGGASAGDTTNDAWVNDPTNALVKLGTKADGSARAAGTDFIAKDDGTFGIGTASPDGTAILDVTSSNKGVLLPRVALTSATDKVTISNPATGLLVYNTGTSTLTYVGYVFWNGSEWRTFNNSSTGSGSIGSINCSAVSLSPATYTASIPYSGTLSVPYTGGNGGMYSAQTVGPVNGLTATLSSGNFANGSGTLSYSVTGSPTVSSPTTTTFNLNIGGQTCTATVGQGRTLAIGEAITAIYSVPVATATVQKWRLGGYVAANNLTPLPVIDGLQIDVLGSDTTYYWPIIENISSSAQLISYQTFATQSNENRTNLNQNLTSFPSSSAAATTAINNGWGSGGGNAYGWWSVDYNQQVYWLNSAAEVETTNIQVQIDANTYRWYEFKWWCMEVGSNKKIFLSVKRVA